MNLLDFNDRFPTESACRVYLVSKREAEGIKCKKCGGEKHYWLENQSIWRCAACRSSTNLYAGTIMEKTHIPLRTWFMCIHLMTSTKKAFSALEMQRQLGMKRYQPVWYMMQKIRKTMGKRDEKYLLHGGIELDGAFFEIVNIAEKDELGNKKDKDDSGKGQQGVGSDKQMKVLVMVESEPLPTNNDKPHKKKRVMDFVKMVTMDAFTTAGTNYEVEKAIHKDSVLFTDGHHSLRQLKKVVKHHSFTVVEGKDASKTLPWVHTVIANTKRLFLGVHHSIGKAYLQNYLNEFCYKLNRRNFSSDLFDRMIVAGVSDTWY